MMHGRSVSQHPRQPETQIRENDAKQCDQHLKKDGGENRHRDHENADPVNEATQDQYDDKE
jgi:hypothetical protein